MIKRRGHEFFFLSLTGLRQGCRRCLHYLKRQGMPQRPIVIFRQKRPSAVLLIHESTDLSEKGVAEVLPVGTDSYEVLSVVEKTEKPKTKFGIGKDTT